MPFCVNCGNENPVGVRFCSKCGTEQVATLVGCSNCGKTLEENEKFCSGCGTPAASAVEPKVETKSKPESKPKKDKLTPEGRKIIDAGPKPDQAKTQSTSPPPIAPTAQKKKKGCMGCLGKSLLIILVLLIVGVVIIWNLPEDEENIVSDTNIPGIVDIELEDEQKNEQPKSSVSARQNKSTENLTESKELKKAASDVENAFAKADTLQLKSMLSTNGLKKYEGLFSEIQPHMPEYAKVFENRKLIISTENYKLYEIQYEKGEKFTAEFMLQPEGTWKLVRF